MEIQETKDYGLANTIDGIIYLHPILNEYPELRKRIIHHEFEHQKSKGFLENRKVDALTEISFKDLFPIYKKHPSLFFKQHSPITYSKKDNTLFFEWSLIFLYSFYLLIGALIIWLISIFSTSSEFFWKVIWYMILILSGVFVLYRIGKELIKKINEEAKENVKETK